ncbi:hypothetical protein ANTPLA_LOCUS5435 [Anthophora plagiata]
MKVYNGHGLTAYAQVSWKNFIRSLNLTKLSNDSNRCPLQWIKVSVIYRVVNRVIKKLLLLVLYIATSILFT